jgi:plasmid stabilization system protein ParE
VTYTVHIEPRTHRDVDEEYRWIARYSAERAEAWAHGAFAAIFTLEQFPRRCPLAPENSDVDVEIRHLLYGEFRILFTVEDEIVHVLHVRHGARRSLTPDELE